MLWHEIGRLAAQNSISNMTNFTGASLYGLRIVFEILVPASGCQSNATDIRNDLGQFRDATQFLSGNILFVTWAIFRQTSSGLVCDVCDTYTSLRSLPQHARVGASGGEMGLLY
jgi:hypothetical protein